jgi:DNA-binding transcriptional ArsR family regulator
MPHRTGGLARLLKVLADETRLRIVRVLKGRVLCVGAIASHLDVTQGAVSQHLRVMRDAGLVIDEKRGYYVHYRLNEQTLVRWRKQIDELLAPGPAVKCRRSKRTRRSCGDEHSDGKRSRR